MVRLLKKIVLKGLGPSLGVNQMWTKKNDHAPKNEGADFIIHAQKGHFWKNKIQVWPFSCLLLGFTCLLFLLNVSKMYVACKSSQNKSFQKNEPFNLYTINVIYMWHVPCVVTWLNRIFSVWLYLMLLPLYLAQH
jgi:hypothetical protein